MITTPIRDYAQAYGRDPLNNFAAACSDQNSTDELLAALASTPYSGDINAWQLTDGEWHAAIRAALLMRGIPA